MTRSVTLFAPVLFILLAAYANASPAQTEVAQQAVDPEVRPGYTVIDSVKQFRDVIHQSGQKIRMKPGVYRISTAEPDNKTVLQFDGSDNYFDLRDVTIEFETQVLANLRGRVHELTVCRILGDKLSFEGGTFESVGDQHPGGGLQEFSIYGADCHVDGCTFIIRGSTPYGYGDLLGKGGPHLATLRKHSGIQIKGRDTIIRNTRVISYAFGHCFFVQSGASNTVLEDCYAEGRIRATSEMLKDTTGPAVGCNFASVYVNREGDKKITPGYMKSLCEDGFRTYSNVGRVTLINCKAVNTRSGFEIQGPKDGRSLTTLVGCEAIGCERAYMLGSHVVTRRCKGDAKYGPLLYLRGHSERSDIELELIRGDSEYHVHVLSTISGKNHRVKLIQQGDEMMRRPTPIMLGCWTPWGGNIGCPLNPGPAKNVEIINETGMPIDISAKAVACQIKTNGEVLKNKGENITITVLENK